MSRTARWWAVALLAMAGIGPVQAQEPDTYSSVKDLERARRERALAGQNIWWERLVPGRLEAKQKAAKERLQAAANAKNKDKEVQQARAVEVSAIQEERNHALRRAAVCQRLREIAEETGDPELEKQADLLESRSWALLEQKTSSSGLARLSPMSEKEAEGKLLAKDKPTEPARAEASPVRTIRPDGKE